MISIEKYTVQIDEGSLNALALDKRYDQAGETVPETARTTALEAAELQAQAIIKNRFGYLPADTGFLETATVAGVIYLLSRKPGNNVDKDQIDQRRQTFFDMLPAATGGDSKAAIQTILHKLGSWI